MNDWYVYGLLISDADFIHSFFRLIEKNSVDPATLLTVRASELVHEFFSSLASLDQMFVSLSSKLRFLSESERADEKLNHLFSQLRKVV